MIASAIAPALGSSCWTDRTTRIQKLAWKADGTPDFGSPLPTTTDTPAPSGE